MSDQLNQLKADMQAYLEVFKAVNVNFAAVVANKSFSLSERWEVWKIAPEDLKRTATLSGAFNFLDSLQKYTGVEWTWYDDYGVDRGQTVDMLRFVEVVENGSNHQNWAKAFIDHPELIDEMKEEILQMNLGSFTLDW